MRWLITTDKNVDLNILTACLRKAGCELDLSIAEPIPLGDEEQVYEVPGPADLAQRLTGQPAIKGIHPDSDLTLY